MKSSLKRHIPLLLIAGLLLGVTSACKTVKLKDAEEKQRLGEYYAAAAMYRKLYTKSKPTQRDLRAYIAYRMGYCNQRANNTGRATSAYLNAERYDYPDSLLPFHLGQVCQKEGRYDEAVKYYREYLAQAPTDLRAVRAIEGCDSAKSWREHSTLYRVARMERFNSRRSECCPMYYGDKYDQLYFNSTRGIVHKDSLNAITGLKNNAFFLVKKDENGAWQKPKEVDDPVASEYDQGTPSFSKDGNTMYYTYCAVDATEPRTAEIYLSTRSGAAWSKGQRADIIKDSLTLLAHPAASPDGKYLYFVADAVGGYGGKDIFRTRLVGASDFGGIENLGPEINTDGDELFPYVRDSVTLYFASDGHPGMGGLDLFKATQDSTGHWHVTNMRAPINSQGDDFGITFEGRRERGFFSSNRGDARGWDHIYSFEYPTFMVKIDGRVSDVD